MRKRGELPAVPERDKKYAQYDVYGHLEKVGNTIKELVTDELRPTQLSEAFKVNRVYKNRFFRLYHKNDDIPEEIEVPIVAIIDEIPFPRV